MKKGFHRKNFYVSYIAWKIFRQKLRAGNLAKLLNWFKENTSHIIDCDFFELFWVLFILVQRRVGVRSGNGRGDINGDDEENIIIVLAYKLFSNSVNCVLRIKHPISHTCSVGQLKCFENLKNVFFKDFSSRRRDKKNN